MASPRRTAPHALAPLFVALLASCGGGGSDSVSVSPAPAPAPSPSPTPSPAPSPAPTPPPPPQLLGTAAVGAALASGQVSVTAADGSPACAETTIVTSGTGRFACTVLSGKSAPFLVVVTDPSGSQPPLVSIATTTPTAGTSLIVNATPLTTAIVGQLAADGNALSVVANPALINVATLASVTSNVLAQLAPTLTALSAPAGYDPFSTEITAATASQGGNTADAVIEMLRFSTVDGVTQVSTIDNPAGAVALAGPSTTNPPPLPAPSATVVSLSDAMRLLTTRLNGCFALPVATRVISQDTSVPLSEGGPEITQAHDACGAIASDDYLHNGYRGGQQFYALLTDPAMVGATFSPVEVMRFLDDTSGADNDRAVINLRFVDANGLAGNIITVAQKFPGTATANRLSDWWLHGNQQPVDTSIRAFIRRNEQLAPNPGTAPFANAAPSRFESGFTIFINKDGPGSTGMRAARVKGPGLPPAGLVYTRPDPVICSDQDWLNIRRKDGLTDPASATFAADVGNIFRLQRTVGVTGADATAVRANPNAGNTNTTAFINWAHPLDYGAAVGATNYIDFSTLKPNTDYVFEIFYDAETAPRYTFNKTLLTAVVPATRGINLQWIALTAGTLDYLNPAGTLAAAQTSINLAWTANPFAETIRSAGVYSFGGGVNVDQGLVNVPRGATSAVAPAPGNSGLCNLGTSFRALTSDGTSGRTIQLRYRTLDGSYKDSTTRYN